MSISVGTGIRFAGTVLVDGVTLVSKHRSSPSSAWPLAGKILRRKRHERQQGGLARASKPNT
tara:strand:+ start:266 stop:451 length:186 start_codon:yes stop_codon:yes gene_type:complete